MRDKRSSIYLLKWYTTNLWRKIYIKNEWNVLSKSSSNEYHRYCRDSNYHILQINYTYSKILNICSYFISYSFYLYFSVYK
jgi:hypothetical protein